jgi:hypothetical protein
VLASISLATYEGFFNICGQYVVARGCNLLVALTLKAEEAMFCRLGWPFMGRCHPLLSAASQHHQNILTFLVCSGQWHCCCLLDLSGRKAGAVANAIAPVLLLLLLVCCCHHAAAGSCGRCYGSGLARQQVAPSALLTAAGCWVSWQCMLLFASVFTSANYHAHSDVRPLLVAVLGFKCLRSGYFLL